MSFILDALKKLEREKETRGAGVVMVGPVQWGGPDRQRQRRRLILATAGLVVLAAGAMLWLAVRPSPTAPPPPATPAATAAPTTAAAPAEAVASAPSPIAVPATPVAPPPPRGLDLPARPSATAPEPNTATPAEAEEAIGEEEAPADAAGGGDTAEPGELPAQDPPPSPPPDVPEYRLTAISERDGRPVALLNDRLVHEGDRFDNLRIIRIGPAEVEIEVDGERRTIGF